jgi:hypothetical protein
MCFLASAEFMRKSLVEILGEWNVAAGYISKFDILNEGKLFTLSLYRDGVPKSEDEDNAVHINGLTVDQLYDLHKEIEKHIGRFP